MALLALPRALLLALRALALRALVLRTLALCGMLAGGRSVGRVGGGLTCPTAGAAAAGLVVPETTPGGPCQGARGRRPRVGGQGMPARPVRRGGSGTVARVWNPSINGLSETFWVYYREVRVELDLHDRF